MLLSYSIICNTHIILSCCVSSQFLILYPLCFQAVWRAHLARLARIMVVSPADGAVTDLLLLSGSCVLSCRKRVCDEAKLITQFQS